MRIGVIANDDQWNELLQRNATHHCKKIIAGNYPDKECTAYIFLDETAFPLLVKTDHPIILNSVVKTIAELQYPPNLVRFNGWNSFIASLKWELAGQMNDSHEKMMQLLNKDFVLLQDEPGFVSARVIAMIINEAYFALGEGISTRPEIDRAMKYGTNYPHGPFEWADIIGVDKIYDLLKTLNKGDCRYEPAPLLKEQVAG